MRRCNSVLSVMDVPLLPILGEWTARGFLLWRSRGHQKFSMSVAVRQQPNREGLIATDDRRPRRRRACAIATASLLRSTGLFLLHLPPITRLEARIAGTPARCRNRNCPAQLPAPLRKAYITPLWPS